jgi:hypothetical protein
MQKLRVLVLAPDCNPESVTTPQIACAHAEALGRLHAVTLVVRAAIEGPVRRAGPFETIHPIRLQQRISLGWAGDNPARMGRLIASTLQGLSWRFQHGVV